MFHFEVLSFFVGHFLFKILILLLIQFIELREAGFAECSATERAERTILVVVWRGSCRLCYGFLLRVILQIFITSIPFVNRYFRKYKLMIVFYFIGLEWILSIFLFFFDGLRRLLSFHDFLTTFLDLRYL